MNHRPIYTKNGRLSSVLVTAANTSSQGGGTVATDIFLLFTAGAEGAYVDFVRWIATATAPANTTATVARIFRSTVSAGVTTSANTHLIGEVTLPLVAADNATTAVNAFDFPLGIALAAGETLLVTNHAAPAATTAWRAVVMGAGDY